jgi:hypothetical protein
MEDGLGEFGLVDVIIQVCGGAKIYTEYAFSLI